MMLNQMMPVLGPVVLAANIMVIFFCLRPKRGILFTIAVLAVCAVAVHFFTLFAVSVNPPLVRFGGIFFFPVMLSLFQGQTFQKLFAVVMPYQLGALPTHLADTLVGMTIGYENARALFMYMALSLVMLAAYVFLMLRFGRRLCERIFVEGRQTEWALYSLGAVFSWVMILTLDWTVVGAELYFGLILFILWGVAVLCFTIINTHEKAAQAHQAQTLLLQMNAMREQTEAEKDHRANMEILRHDMRHEMGAIMELFRTGKAAEAETVFSQWQTSLSEAAPAAICAEPVLNAVFSRFERKAKDKNIKLYVKSNIPASLPIDTIKLSVMVSNALENALTATDKVLEQNKRAVRVKLLQNGSQVGFEVANPCSGPVVLNGKGFPTTHESNHGIGVRSIAAFAKDNGYMLDFSYPDGKFTLRLVMDLN